ncbi:GAF domain-containing protein [Egbenema bharatensis]|uniref:GAF domain-containing protein n=1 Tax=Egbenema bharatensis TaxID=3463334 RepID=UPI003A87D129
MTSPLTPHSSGNALPSRQSLSRQSGLHRVISHLTESLQQDMLVRQTVYPLQTSLQVDRIVLYHFYRPWKGQVTYEALSDGRYSILGSTGADDCFNDEYADLYLTGRIRAIADVNREPIHECHRAFLQSLQIKANLVVPVLTASGLWGLLIAHHCRSAHPWTDWEIEQMQKGAEALAAAPSIRAS